MSSRRKGPTPRRRPPGAAVPPETPTGLSSLLTSAGTMTPAASPRPAASTQDGPQPSAPAEPTSTSRPVPAPAVPAPAPPVVVAGPLAPPGGLLRVSTLSCSALEDVEAQALGVTYWYDAPASGAPVEITVRFEGQRVDGPDSELPVQFSTQTTVARALAGSGRAAVTARVTDLAPGTYAVRATEVSPRPSAPSAPVQGRTSFAPVVKVSGPGVVLGAWPALVLLGTLLALLLQNRLALREDLPAGRVLALTAVACVVGTIGAKVYYLLTHRGQPTGVPTAGMSVQGFVLGAVGTLIVGSALLDLQIARVLDITAPGLLFGMTVGRFGCLLGGCCAGRATASRWGVRSSDRRLLVRRIPVQLLEGGGAALAGGAALLLLLAGRGQPAGAVFVGAMAMYVLGRQLLFPLRSLPRTTTYGRALMIAATIALVIASAAALA